MLVQGKYYEAVCQDIDPKNKNIVACFPKDTGLEEACFRVPYDILVVGASVVACGRSTIRHTSALLYAADMG